MVNLVEEGYDLALRASNKLDPGLTALPVANILFQLFGAPSYFDRMRRPKALDDLPHSEFLAYTPLAYGGEIQLYGSQGPRSFRFEPVLRSDNETLLLQAALTGMGLAFLPAWLVQEDVAAGRLEPVLADEVSASVQLYCVYPSREYLPAKVSSFIETMSALNRYL
jgi:DNA-binding transcriptional LysR family regulator